MRRHDDKFIQYLRVWVPLANTYILEVGCGSGFRTQQMSEAGARVLGIDDNPHAIRQAQLRAHEQKTAMPQALFANNSLLNLQAEDDTFEAIVFSFSLHHFGRLDMKSAIDQAIRVVKPGGTVAFFEPGTEGSLYEAELLFQTRTDDERIAKACAYEAMCSHGGLTQLDEMFYTEVFEFGSLEDFGEAMKPKGNVDGLAQYLDERDYLLNAPRRLNVYRANK